MDLFIFKLLDYFLLMFLLLLLAGLTAVFKCQIRGEPKPKLTWTKGRKVLTTTKDEKVKVFYDEENDLHTIVMKGW